MSTTMLQALADEARSITKEIDAAAQIWVTVRHRATLLAEQIQVMDQDAKNLTLTAPASITQHATPEEFQAFQARFFPYRAVSDAPAPGIQPQTQDNRQATHGSDEAAPGAGDVALAQSEQVVTAAVSEEQGPACVEPDTAPETSGVPADLRERCLEMYATTDKATAEIASLFRVSNRTLGGILRYGRHQSDKRVATGDLARAPGALERGEITPNQARAAASLAPVEERLPLIEEEIEERPARGPAPGKCICEINLSEREVTHNDKTIIVTRSEIRVLNALNSGAPLGIEGMFQHMSVSTKRRLDTDLGKLNGRLGAIRLMIEWHPGDEYRLVAMD